MPKIERVISRPSTVPAERSADLNALDFTTDKALRKSLATECKGTTKVIVAQRIGTIRDADRIIVLDQGRMVGNGTHDELMRSCETYQEIASSQLSKEELAHA